MARDDQSVKVRLISIALLVAACTPQEKQKSDDPTVVAEDLDEPVDLSVNTTGAFWTTQPIPRTVSATGSGKPSALQFIAIDGGDARTLISGLNRPSAISTDDERVYWLDLSRTDTQQLNAMRFNGDERVVLVAFDKSTEGPTQGTRLIPYRGKLYFGGARNLWAVPADGGVPESLVRARTSGGSISVALVDARGIYFREKNLTQGIDLKHVALSGAGAGEDPGAWVMTDAGVEDGGTVDGGIPDGGETSDGGGFPPEAPGVTLLRRGFVLSGTTNVAIANEAVYWFSNSLLGGTMYRAPFNGGPEAEVVRFPANGGATDLASDGRDVLYLVSTNVGGLLYRVDNDTSTTLHQLGLLNSGTPRVLRLDDTSAWFFAGGGTLSRLHRVQRLRGVDAGVPFDGGVDGGP